MTEFPNPALDNWVKDNSKYIFCFVSLFMIEVGNMPQIYLATGAEVGKELGIHNLGCPTYYLEERRIQHTHPEWKMDEARIREVFKNAEEQGVTTDRSP